MVAGGIYFAVAAPESFEIERSHRHTGQCWRTAIPRPGACGPRLELKVLATRFIAASRQNEVAGAIYTPAAPLLHLKARKSLNIAAGTR